MKLYEELAGHPYRPEQDEQCAFDLEQHTAAINPYDHPDATMMGVHLQRLAHVFSCARVRRGELLLDMGCGWGLSSEVAAYLGLRVLGVDINPDFVSLVNRRAARTSYPISAVHGTFDGFSSPGPVDLVMFYECLHHAVNPLAVVSRYAAALRPGGRMMLAGEPINANWWPHWGMRLDALSIYCIRKFGWFESGWSIDHIQEVMRRAGLVPVVHSHGDPVVAPRSWLRSRRCMAITPWALRSWRSERSNRADRCHQSSKSSSPTFEPRPSVRVSRQPVWRRRRGRTTALGAS